MYSRDAGRSTAAAGYVAAGTAVEPCETGLVERPSQEAEVAVMEAPDVQAIGDRHAIPVRLQAASTNSRYRPKKRQVLGPRLTTCASSSAGLAARPICLVQAGPSDGQAVAPPYRSRPGMPGRTVDVVQERQRSAARVIPISNAVDPVVALMLVERCHRSPWISTHRSVRSSPMLCDCQSRTVASHTSESTSRRAGTWVSAHRPHVVITPRGTGGSRPGMRAADAAWISPSNCADWTSAGCRRTGCPTGAP